MNNDLKKYIVVVKGSPRFDNRGFVFESCSFRDILVQLAKELTKTTFSKDDDVKLFQDIIYSLPSGKQAKQCLELFNKFFKYEIVFLGELSHVHYCGPNFKTGSITSEDDDLPF